MVFTQGASVSWTCLVTHLFLERKLTQLICTICTSDIRGHSHITFCGMKRRINGIRSFIHLFVSRSTSNTTKMECLHLLFWSNVSYLEMSIRLLFNNYSIVKPIHSQLVLISMRNVHVLNAGTINNKSKYSFIHVTSRELNVWYLHQLNNGEKNVEVMHNVHTRHQRQISILKYVQRRSRRRRRDATKKISLLWLVNWLQCWTWWIVIFPSTSK